MKLNSFMSAQGCQTMSFDDMQQAIQTIQDQNDEDDVQIANEKIGYSSVIYQQIKPQQYQHMIRSSLGSTHKQSIQQSQVTSGSLNMNQTPHTLASNYNNFTSNYRGISRNTQIQTQIHQQQYNTLQARTTKSQKGVRYRNQNASALATQQYPPMLPNRARMNQTQIGLLNNRAAVKTSIPAQQRKNIFAVGKNFGSNSPSRNSFPRVNSSNLGLSAAVQCSFDTPYMDQEVGSPKQKKTLRSANPSNNEMKVRRDMAKSIRHSLHAQRQQQNDLSSLLPRDYQQNLAFQTTAIKSELPSCTTSQEIESVPKSQEVSVEDPTEQKNERVKPILIHDQRMPILAHHIFKTTKSKSQINNQRQSNVQRIREIKMHLSSSKHKNDKLFQNTTKFGTEQSISEMDFSSSKINMNPLQVTLFKSSGSPDRNPKQKSVINQPSQREDQINIDEYLMNKTEGSIRLPTYESADNNRSRINESDRHVSSIYQNQLTKKIERLKLAKAGNPIMHIEEKSKRENPLSSNSRAHSKLSNISVSMIQKHGPKRPTSQQLMRHYQKPVRCEAKCAKALVVQKQKQIQKNSEYKNFNLEQQRRGSAFHNSQGKNIETLAEDPHEESSSSWSQQSLKKNKTITDPQSQEKIVFLSSPKAQTRDGSCNVTARRSVERQSSFKRASNVNTANIAGMAGSGPNSLTNLKIQPFRTSIAGPIKIEESQEDDILCSNLQHKTAFLIEHGMIWDKYKFDPATIVDTLAKNVDQRNKNIDDFIEKIAGEYVAPENREEFRVDLMRYLQKQRNLLIIHKNQEGEGKIEEYVPKSEIKGPKSVFEAIPHDKIRCQVHQKIAQALKKMNPNMGSYLPQCCMMEHLDNSCFDYEFQEVITKDNWIQRKVLGTAQPVYSVKGVWFKDEKKKEQYYEQYEDVDQQLLDRMEYYLKYQFKGMYESTKKKIKAIDAVFDMEKNKTLNGLEYKPADQKLAEEIQTNSIYDIEDDLKPINILQIPVQKAGKNPLLSRQNVQEPLAAFGLKRTSLGRASKQNIGGVREQDQLRLQNTLSRMVTENLGLMLGSKAAKKKIDSFAAVDEKQLYGANITHTQLMASKLALNDLLNHKTWNNKDDIKLGQTLQKKHDFTIKKLIYGKNEKPPKTQKKKEKDSNDCSEEDGDSMNLSDEEDLFDKQKSNSMKDLIKAVVKKSESNLSPGKLNASKKETIRNASKIVKSVLHKRYEQQFQLRQEQEKKQMEEEQLKIMLWEDIPEHYMRKVRKVHQHYFRHQRDEERRILDQKSQAVNYRSPSKIEQEKRALDEADEYLSPDLTKEEFIEIITDLIRLNIVKQQQIVTEFKNSEDPTNQQVEVLSEEDEQKQSDVKLPEMLGFSRKATFRGAGAKVRVGVKLGGSSGISSTKQTIPIFQDYIKQAAFYRDLKRNPNSFLKESQRYHIEFLNKCTYGNSLSIPAFKTMLQGKSLVMNNYYMDQTLVDALIQHVDQTCQSSARTSIENLIVYDCGLNDTQLASILQLLNKSPLIKHIKLGKSVLGPLSIQELCLRIKGDSRAQNKLTGLTINQALNVADNIHFHKIFKQISSESRIQSLKLMNVNLTRDKKVLDYLLQYLNLCPQDLVTLKLSNNCFQSKHLVEISHALTENTFICDLDLSGNKLCRQKSALNKKIIHNLTIFSFHNIKLRHLNLRGMHLYLALEVFKDDQEPKKEEKETKCTKKHKKIVEVDDNEKSLNENIFQRFMTVLFKSRSIQSIHLSDNGFSHDQKDSIYILFNVKVKKGKIMHCKEDNEADEILEKINQKGNSKSSGSPNKQSHSDVTTVQINQLKELYNTYEVNNNKNLTDHAKVINNQLLQNFNQTKNCELDGNKTDHTLIDVFNDDIILHRKIGHSELVFDYIQNFFGSLSKDFGKNWQLATKDTVSDCFICQRHQYVQIFFRRSTITDDFDIIHDENMITILNRLYGLEDKKNNNYTLLNDDFHIPIILGSVTDWHAQEMIAGQVYIQLLLFYFLKGELRRVGNETEEHMKDPTKSGRRTSSGIYAQELEELFDIMIEKILKNQLLIDREECGTKNPLWYKLFHSFKKINRDAVTQVNMFSSLNKSEVDVFVFSGYLKPGLHSIIIYDPIEKLYYKKSIVVEIGKNSDKKIELENMLDELKSELVKKGSKTVNVFQQWHNDVDLATMKSMLSTIGKSKKSSTMKVHEDSSKSQATPQETPIKLQRVTQDEPQARISHYLKQAFNIDTVPKNFKPYFFVADQQEINNCLDLLQLYYREIKNLYIYISTSRGDSLSQKEELQYPFISQNRITDFLYEINILQKPDPIVETIKNEAMGDQKTIETQQDDPENVSVEIKDEQENLYKLDLETINEIFRQTNVEYEDDDANPDDSLNRVELMEFLMRIAQAQRKLMLTLQDFTDQNDRKLGSKNIDYSSHTISDQLENIIQDKLLPYNQKRFSSLLNFKDSHYLQSKSVSELLDANFRGISLLYSQYQTKGYDKKFTVESLRNMLIDSNIYIKFSEEMILQLFAFAKMTVVNETNYPDYYKLEFIEFQVMLGLLAKIYFDCNMGIVGISNEKDIELYEKITGQIIKKTPAKTDEKQKQEENNKLSILGSTEEQDTEPVEFHPEMLLYILEIVLRQVNMNCQNFEDIENQKAFLENQI